jgi:hypothetical protein
MRFDRFEAFVDLIKIEEIEIEHLEIQSLVSESMQ